MDEAVQTVCVYNTANMLCAGMDALPAHAVVDNPNVIVLWNEAANAWNEIPQCNWVACEEGFYKDGDQCARGESTTDCAGMDSVPSHADVLNPLVSIHYDSATGEWTKPEACTWSKCEEGWHAENNACASNEKEVACHDAAPAHAVSIPANVVVTWNEEEGAWNAPADCAWDCLQNYHPADNGCAGDEQDVECLGGTPANATASNATIHQIYGDNGWEPAATDCDWKCNASPVRFSTSSPN